MHLVTLALFCACLYLVKADTCTVDLSIAMRPGATWPGPNGEHVAIYDISATNIGSCVVNNIGINIFFPETASISNQWNLLADSRYWLLQNFGDALAPQATTTAGIIVSFAAGAAPDFSTVTLEVYGAACPSSCQTAQSSSSSSSTVESSSEGGVVCIADIRDCPDGSTVGRDPTNNCEFFDCPAGSSSSSSEDGVVCIADIRDCPDGSTVGRDPTNNCEFFDCPASSDSSSGSSDCNIVATMVRDDNVWTDDKGRSNAVYRLSISNQGSCPLKTYVTSFAYYPGELTSSWNLSPSLGGFKVEGFGDHLAPGQTYTGAGIIVAGAPDNTVAVTPYGSVCEC